jgi:hypothetical protein
MNTTPRTSQTELSTTCDAENRPRQPGMGGTGPAGAAPAPARSPGHRKAVPGTAALRPMPGQGLPRGRVDAGGSRLRLRALHVMGHGPARIARALGVRQATIAQLVRGDATTISPRLRDAITDLYDAWWDKRAPERTRAERAAALAARRRAIVGNWCAAAALDDDLLDTPGYRPRQGWKPATGTGVAPDIHPTTRRHPRRKGA